jgi:regulation of enolase protein 1 (concanavalin A-like superfamily)
MNMIVQGFIAAATVLWLMSYIGFRRIFAHAFVIDLVVTVGFVVAFAGSYAGMMTGVIAGLMVSMFIKAGRKLVGTERVRLVRRKGNIIPTFVWIRSKS